MNQLWSIFLVIFLPYSITHAELAIDKKLELSELQRCFLECWGIDSHTTQFISRYFVPFFEQNDQLHHVRRFIDASVKLDIRFSLDKKLASLPPHDGVILATKFHPVVYETPYVRILAGCAEPGEREPFHTHSWKSILVIFEEASYFVEYANGSSEFLIFKPGVYELQSEDFYACTNIGKKKENCLRFEVKE